LNVSWGEPIVVQSSNNDEEIDEIIQHIQLEDQVNKENSSTTKIC
jgi:hypothetical protein